jgi:MFS family permease
MTLPGGSPPAVGRPRLLAAELLSDHDYRHYWLGSTAFALGIWGFLVSMGVSARVLTDSPLRISLVTVAYFLPMFLFALPSGVLADTVDRRLTVMVSRGVSAAGALVLAALTAGDRLSYPALLALCALTGATVVSEVAARQAYVTQVVRADQVVGATALGSVQGGVARVLGPLIAGWLIGRWGQSAGYLFFAAANLACVVVFLRIRASGVPVRSGGRPVAELVAGLRYLRRTPDALAVVTVAIGTGVVGWVYLALMPLVATDRLGGGAFTLGLLSMGVGLGSVPPSLALAVRSGRLAREGALFYGSTFAWAAGVVVYGLTSSTAVALAALAVAGAGSGLQQVLMRTLLIRLTDPAFHGRVLGTLMLTWGANVVGTLGGGLLAESLGVGPVIVLSGVLIAAVPVGVLLVRPGTWRL